MKGMSFLTRDADRRRSAVVEDRWDDRRHVAFDVGVLLWFQLATKFSKKWQPMLKINRFAL